MYIHSLLTFIDIGSQDFDDLEAAHRNSEKIKKTIAIIKSDF
jgi:hypothetical protein